MNRTTTEELENILHTIDHTDELRDFIGHESRIRSEESFAEYFNSLPEIRGSERADLIRQSGIERTYAYQILNGLRKPGRDKVIALSIAAGLDLRKLQRSLRTAGCSPLYARNRRDAILLYAVNRKFNVSETEELLDQMGEETLADHSGGRR